MKRTLFLLVLISSLVVAGPAFSQANTGKITGIVSSEDGEGIPGVTITATSSAFQGQRVVVSRENGAYILPQLPAGDYELRFELEGFQPVLMPAKVNANQAAIIDQRLSLSDLTEEILVTGQTETISTSVQSMTTYDKDVIEALAITGSIEDVTVLAPGVHASGPQRGGAINQAAISISGSQSYENLFMVNGVVVNENSRGQAIEFIIEDAVQETTISTSGISAEYGRFNGGVINVITKSGGNNYHGSFRANVSKETWQGQNPLNIDTEQDDTQNETYMATLGGRILKDKIWFFVAARDLERAGTDTLQFTSIGLNQDRARDRQEYKLTVSPHSSHRLIGTFSERFASTANEHFSAVDLTTVNPSREDIEELTSFNYTGVLTANFFLEAQYSERILELGVGSGGTSFDRIEGTWFLDAPNFTFINSPVFCAICLDTQRNNENTLVKASYFAAGQNGSHDIVVGYDSFNDINIVENHQSSSDFTVWGLDPFIVRGEQVFPQVSVNTWNRLRWDPVLEPTQGMMFQTDSLFINDTWRLGDKWSFNIGFRYDENDTVDGGGATVSDDSKLAPRLGLTYDLKGDGDLVFNASYGEYAASINTGANIGGGLGSGGALGNWTWRYGGPEINTDPTTATADLLTSEEALAIIFAWWDNLGGLGFNEPCDAAVNGFVNCRSNLTIPGLGIQVPEGIVTPSSEEFTLGATKRLGSKGMVRVDVVSREFGDFYGSRIDTGTGKVTNPDGSQSDLEFFGNDDGTRDRKYFGIHSQFSYRLNNRLTLAGNYSHSNSYGNFVGETTGNAALATGQGAYPEYKAFANNLSSGHLVTDQQKKAALWAVYKVLQREHHNLSASLLMRYTDGRPYIGSGLDGPGLVATGAFVDNAALGYLEPPGSVDYWYFPRNFDTTGSINSIDLALNYAFAWSLGGKSIEVFFQPEVVNVLNKDGQMFLNSTVLDPVLGGMTPFNPFTETPVEGVNFAKGPNFGQVTSDDDYQRPREFRFSVGFRF